MEIKTPDSSVLTETPKIERTSMSDKILEEMVSTTRHENTTVSNSPASRNQIPLSETETPEHVLMSTPYPTETVLDIFPEGHTESSSIGIRNYKAIRFSYSIKKRTRETEPQLYSGPSTEYCYVMGAHPSLVSKPIACAGEDHGWLLVRYKVGSMNRIGYIERITGDEIPGAKALSYDNKQVFATEDCSVSDGIDDLAHVKEGDSLTLLGIISEYDSSKQLIPDEKYVALVEVTGDEGIARGVLKVTQIKDAEQ